MTTDRPTVFLSLIFFVSGFPALLYQLVWQRSLFAIFGINIESVTVVVAAFMLGLGLGSLAGGRVSERSRAPLLLVFALAEYAIGAFGVFSLDVFHWVGWFSAGGSTLQTGVVAFLVVVLPTVLMGATLPVLVTWLVRRTGNVGRSVGLLYFVNTVGSAVACFAAAWWLMRYLGMTGTVRLAASLNVVVGTGALLLALRTRSARPSAEPDAAPDAAPDAEPAGDVARPSRHFALALALVGVTGFISLSYEILWVRVYSFTSGGMAAAFALLLGAYLVGIAFGSLASRPFCREAPTGDPRQLRALGAFVLAANLLGFLAVPLVALLVQHIDFRWTLVVVAVAAAGLGAAFPLLCHFGIPADARSGARLSHLYLANIVGSTLGSLVTGFVFVSIWSLQGIATFLALFGLAVSAAILALARVQGRARTGLFAGMGVAAVAIVVLANPLFDSVYAKLQLKSHYRPGFAFGRIHESRSGIVTIKTDGRVYGSGIYDGKISTSLVPDRNGVTRVYSMSALHPAPKRVLEIGLSTGAWAQIIANHPQVEHLTVVEIDEGYLDLIPHYPQVASVLTNPKVEIVIDDGRRWLVAHPEEKFDAIIMNTTFNWRAHVSNILSVEFLQLVRAHLREGGYAQVNTTSAPRVYATGLSVFPHAVRMWNNLALSDTPFDFDKERWRSVLSQYAIDGKPVFDLSKARHRRRLEDVVGRIDGVYRSDGRRSYMERTDSLLGRFSRYPVVTDDNMGTEWDNATALTTLLRESQ